MFHYTQFVAFVSTETLLRISRFNFASARLGQANSPQQGRAVGEVFSLETQTYKLSSGVLGLIRSE